MQTSIIDKEKQENAVLQTLQYFNIFKHPLTLEEIHQFLAIDVPLKKLYTIVTIMAQDGMLLYSGGYYMLDKQDTLVQRRNAGKERADKLMPLASKSAKVVSKFPFVKCICISGSLSKGYANEKSDIDLFVITTSKRLWICRTILHVFKKLTFVWGSQHSYCMNYFIDESKLCLEEQNLFTATELATLIPVYNPIVHKELIDANKCWLVNLYPNINWNDKVFTKNIEPNYLKKISESLINIFFPKQLNIGLMKLTDTLWRMKWRRKNYPMKDYDLAMKTKWYVSKNHPINYQKKVLTHMEPKLHSNMSAAMS